MKSEGKLKFAQLDQFPEAEHQLSDSYQFLGCSPQNCPFWEQAHACLLHSQGWTAIFQDAGGWERGKQSNLQLDTAQHFSLNQEPNGSAHNPLKKFHKPQYLSSLVFLRVWFGPHWIIITWELVENWTPSQTCGSGTSQGKGSECVSLQTTQDQSCSLRMTFISILSLLNPIVVLWQLKAFLCPITYGSTKGIEVSSPTQILYFQSLASTWQSILEKCQPLERKRIFWRSSIEKFFKNLAPL